MSEIIVASVEQAETAPDLLEPGAQWVVEGDYGYLGSFVSRKDAYNLANEIAADAGATVQGNE